MLKSFYDAEIEEIFESLKTSKKGLSSKEAEERLKKYGRNVLPRKKKDGIIKIFFREFLDPLVLLLFVAIIASLVAGEIIDAFVILGIILVDVILGVYQENRANTTAESLANYIKVKVRVLREGEVEQIDAEEPHGMPSVGCAVQAVVVGRMVGAVRDVHARKIRVHVCIQTMSELRITEEPTPSDGHGFSA